MTSSQCTLLYFPAIISVPSAVNDIWMTFRETSTTVNCEAPNFSFHYCAFVFLSLTLIWFEHPIENRGLQFYSSTQTWQGTFHYRPQSPNECGCRFGLIVYEIGMSCQCLGKPRVGSSVHLDGGVVFTCYLTGLLWSYQKDKRYVQLEQRHPSVYQGGHRIGLTEGMSDDRFLDPNLRLFKFAKNKYSATT